MPRKEELDRRGYSLSPQEVSEWFWYYEEPKGLCCIAQPRGPHGGVIAIPAWHIPWSLIERSMKRRQAAKRRRRR